MVHVNGPISERGALVQERAKVSLPQREGKDIATEFCFYKRKKKGREREKETRILRERRPRHPREAQG